MSITPPDPISPAPLPAPVRGQKATFSDRIDAFVTWVTASVSQFAASASSAYNNALEAYNWAMSASNSAALASSSAAAAAASSNAVKWVSGTTYADGAVVWSPITRLSYRRNGAGAGTTDPSNDAPNWVLQLYTLGIGGVTAAGSITLLNTSGGALRVTPTGPGYFVTLPDATTMVKGALAFSIHNAGTDDYGIRDNSGVQLGWVRAGQCAVIGLASNATAAGLWTSSNASKIGVTAFLNLPSVVLGNGSQPFEAVPIDGTRTLLLFGNLYAAVYDSSSQSWGSAILVRSSGVYVSAILSATNQVMIASCPALSTALQVVTLTISGTAITVNAAATATAASNVTGMERFVAVNGSFAFAYSYNNGSGTQGGAVRGVSVSGTTPTVGAEAVFGTVEALPRLFVTGTTLRAVTYGSTTALKALPYTISGAALTPGTAGTAAASLPSTAQLWAFLNGNGNLVARYIDNNGLTSVAVFKLTGTTEAASAVQLLNVPTYRCAYAEISPGKVVFVTDGNTNNSLMWNVLTDTAGTASVGTLASWSTSAFSTHGLVDVSGNTVRFSAGGFVVSLDCSGTSAVLTGAMPFSGISSFGQSSLNGGRTPERLVAGGNVYAITSSQGAGGASDGLFGPRAIMPLSGQSALPTQARPGNAANESWALYGSNSTAPISIKRFEAAA